MPPRKNLLSKRREAYKQAKIKPKHEKQASELFGDLMAAKRQRNNAIMVRRALELGFRSVNDYKAAAKQGLMNDHKKFYYLRAANATKKKERPIEA